MPRGARPSRLEVVSTVFAQRVAWRRLGMSRDYVGTLWLGEDGVRLVGREPESGIELALAIPFDEIEAVRVPPAGEERLGGDESVVLDLAGSGSLVLREISGGPSGRGKLVARLTRGLARADAARPARRGRSQRLEEAAR